MVEGVAEPVLDLFRKYSWPGNIRELENVIRRAVFKGRSEIIRREDLPFDFAEQTGASALILGNFHQLMQEHTRRVLMDALSHCGGNRTKAASMLGLSRTQFYRLTKVHGLDGSAAEGGARPNPEEPESRWQK